MNYAENFMRCWSYITLKVIMGIGISPDSFTEDF